MSSDIISGKEITDTISSLANTSYRLEFFSNSITDFSGFDEGQNFLSYFDLETDENCNADCVLF